jgi:hypothetical protein
MGETEKERERERKRGREGQSKCTDHVYNLKVLSNAKSNSQCSGKLATLPTMGDQYQLIIVYPSLAKPIGPAAKLLANRYKQISEIHAGKLTTYTQWGIV